MNQTIRDMSNEPRGTVEAYLSTLLSATELERVLPPATNLQAILKSQVDASARIRYAEQQCLAELELIRERAYRTGYQAGLQEGLSKLEKPLSDLKRAAGEYQSQIVELVIQCVKKICKDVPAGVLMPKVIEQVLEEQVDDIRAIVTVHSTIAAELSVLSRDNITIEVNDEMALTDATVETSDYIKTVCLETQISQLHDQLNSGECRGPQANAYGN